jgi:hypothetical protein
MEELSKQVKSEMLRTLIWLLISLGVGSAIFLVVWK